MFGLLSGGNKTSITRKHVLFISAGDYEVFATYALRNYNNFFYIIIVYYGDSRKEAASKYKDADELYFRKGSKYQNLKYVAGRKLSNINLAQTVSVWDDDARIQSGTLYDVINNFVCDASLKVIGPAQHPSGLVPHSFMKPVYSNAVRVTNYTEMNYVTFKQDAFRKFIKLYDTSVCGWGIDLFFCQLFDPTLKKGVVGIIDSVVVLNKQKRIFGPSNKPNGVSYKVYKSEMDMYVPRHEREQQWVSFASSSKLRTTYKPRCIFAKPVIDDTLGVVSELPTTSNEVRATHSKASLKVSILCACQDRTDSLLKSLPTWLDCPYVVEVIVVDWSSKEPLHDNTLIKDYIDQGYVRLIRVDGESYFSLAKSYNLAKDFAACSVLMKMDADYVLKSSTWMDALRLKRNNRGKYCLLKNYFLQGWWYFSKSLSGFCLVNKADWVDYNENFIGWGYDDTDFYARLSKSGLKSVRFNSITDFLEHIPHEHSVRVSKYPLAKKRQSEIRNKLIAENTNLPMRCAYETTYKSFKYSSVEYTIKHADSKDL